MPESELSNQSISASPGESRQKAIAVIGGGPAGLMAAEVLAAAGFEVDVYDAMPTLGRKFLRAGLGGLNITHSEPYGTFVSRYGDRQKEMQALLDRLPPDALREWVHRLGIKTFVGSSGRVFPSEMKAAPLLRAWLQRLRHSENGSVRLHVSTPWLGFNDDGSLRMSNSAGEFSLRPAATILALGGASWPQLGSTGAWVPWLAERGVEIAPWQSANCGFDVAWSAHLREKFAGAPLKSVALTFVDVNGRKETKEGELLVSDYGIEGSLIYTFSRRLRDYINLHGQATFTLDLLPSRSAERVKADLARPRGSRSLSRHLQSTLGISGLKAALLYEVLSRDEMNDSVALAKAVKALPIKLLSARPLAESISTAGGVTFGNLDENLMLKALPGIFVAGEMLDWEAPTGGYLLSGCFASGYCAGQGVKRWLESAGH